MSAQRLARFVARDGAIVAAAGVLWIVALRSPGAVAVNVAAGVASAVPGYLLHEWGHLAGAWSGRSAVRIPSTILSPFLFNFDVGRNSRAQFTAMALGGFVASLAWLGLVAAAAPWPALCGKIALILNGSGIAAILVFEVPTAWRVHRGAPLPQQGPAFVSTPRGGGP